MGSNGTELIEHLGRDWRSFVNDLKYISFFFVFVFNLSIRKMVKDKVYICELNCLCFIFLWLS